MYLKTIKKLEFISSSTNKTSNFLLTEKSNHDIISSLTVKMAQTQYTKGFVPFFYCSKVSTIFVF